MIVHNWEETPGQSQNLQEGLHIPSGREVSWHPSGKAKGLIGVGLNGQSGWLVRLVLLESGSKSQTSLKLSMSEFKKRMSLRERKKYFL